MTDASLLRPSPPRLPEPGYAYQGVYAYLGRLIAEATGERRVRLPSLRDLAQRLRVSVSTVQHAYHLLESEGKVVSVPKSGYYAAVSKPLAVPRAPGDLDLLHSLYSHACTPGMQSLHQSDPCSSDAMAQLLSRQEREVQRQHPGLVGHPLGEPELRRELAARYTRSTEHYWCADNVYLGADLRALVDITLDALQVRGQTVLISSPASPMLLMALKAAGANIAELPLDAQGDLDLERFACRLRASPVALVVLDSALNAAQGTLMPVTTQQLLATLLDHHGTLLLEDDDHNALCFSVPQPLREMVDPGRVLSFGSFARMIGAEAGYGYLVTHALAAPLRQSMLQRDFQLPPVRQKAIARLCRRGAIDRHLEPLRTGLQLKLGRLVQQLDDELGDLLTVRRPRGGTGVWARSLHSIDGRKVYERLLARRILIAPGEVFSVHGYHDQCLRMGCPVDGRGLPPRVIAELRNALLAARR